MHGRNAFPETELTARTRQVGHTPISPHRVGDHAARTYREGTETARTHWEGRHLPESHFPRCESDTPPGVASVARALHKPCSALHGLCSWPCTSCAAGSAEHLGRIFLDISRGFLAEEPRLAGNSVNAEGGRLSWVRSPWLESVRNERGPLAALGERANPEPFGTEFLGTRGATVEGSYSMDGNLERNAYHTRSALTSPSVQEAFRLRSPTCTSPFGASRPPGRHAVTCIGLPRPLSEACVVETVTRNRPQSWSSLPRNWVQLVLIHLPSPTPGGPPTCWAACGG